MTECSYLNTSFCKGQSMSQFLSGIHIRVLRFLKRLLQCIQLSMGKLGATATLFSGDKEIVVQTAVRVTRRKSTQRFKLCI